MYQTTFKTIQSDEPILAGNEFYPIWGNLIPEDQVRTLFSKCCAGTRRSWDCQTKADRLASVLPNSFVVLGSLYIWTDTLDSNYGYEYNPPFEFHAWVVHKNKQGVTGFIDFALPGVIEMGSATVDSVGPILRNRTPAILCGTPKSWMSYRPIVALQKLADGSFVTRPIQHGA